jgi:hypothetical protein
MAIDVKFLGNSSEFKFKALPKLVFREDSSKEYVKYGANNLYVNEYVRLYNEHPEHRAIVNKKSRYIAGIGITTEDKANELLLNEFINKFSSKDSLEKLKNKIALYAEMYNSVFFEVITNLQGKPVVYNVLNNVHCRLNENKDVLYFSKNWKKGYTEKYKKINKYKEGQTEAGTFFLEFRYTQVSSSDLDDVYSKPVYQSVLNDINTDIDISTFNQNYVSNGFSVGKMIVFFNGTPSSEIKAEIDNRFKGTYGGEDGENVMVVHVDRDDKAPEIVDVSISDLSQKFEFTSKRALKKIFSGHELSPELFNIKFDDSFFSSSADLVTIQELFIHSYVQPRQKELVEYLNYLFYLKNGKRIDFTFKPLSVVGINLTQDVDLTQDERRKLKGYEPLTAPKLDETGNPLPVQANEVNDNLKGLSASENRDMQRIIRDFQAKKNGMNEHLAIARLTAYGLPTNEAKKMLGINTEVNLNLSTQTDKVYLALEACAIDDNDDDETILVEAAHIHNSKDALKYERHIMKFANELVKSVKELDDLVIKEFEKNKNLTPEEIAKNLNYDISKIYESIDRLKKNNSFPLTGLTPKKDIKVETYTVYKYAVDPEKPALKPGGKSRDFCVKMMNLSKFKSWTFEALDKMSNDLGTNVWDYRGGYYTNRITKEIDPECRHYFIAITKTRKVQ